MGKIRLRFWSVLRRRREQSMPEVLATRPATHAHTDLSPMVPRTPGGGWGGWTLVADVPERSAPPMMARLRHAPEMISDSILTN